MHGVRACVKCPPDRTKYLYLKEFPFADQICLVLSSLNLGYCYFISLTLCIYTSTAAWDANRQQFNVYLKFCEMGFFSLMVISHTKQFILIYMAIYQTPIISLNSVKKNIELDDLHAKFGGRLNIISGLASHQLERNKTNV